jgi:hypothetical protein
VSVHLTAYGPTSGGVRKWQQGTVSDPMDEIQAGAHARFVVVVVDSSTHSCMAVRATSTSSSVDKNVNS